MTYVFRYVKMMIMEQKLVFYVDRYVEINSAYLISIIVIHVSV